MKRKINLDKDTISIIGMVIGSIILLAFVQLFLHLYGQYCLGEFDDLLKEAETVEILYGKPYTEEYDYSLEKSAVPETMAVELSAVVAEPMVIETIVEIVTEAVTEPQETEPPVPETEVQVEEDPAPQIVWTDLDETYAVVIAKTLYGECRACSKEQQAAVVWCILNRVDSAERYFPDDIIAVITQPYQFLGYNEANPVREDLLEMARDVMMRWYAERLGAEDVGRVLPRSYCFFTGDGKLNHFTEQWKGTVKWDWSLTSPYAD